MTDTRKWTDAEEGTAKAAEALLAATTKQWHANFDERQQRLIKNCREYADGDPAGLPGHEILKIVAKFAFMMDTMEGLITDLAGPPKADQGNSKPFPFTASEMREMTAAIARGDVWIARE